MSQHDEAMNAALLEIDAKNRRFEEGFKAGDMDKVADDFYTVDARYLTGGLELLRGRKAIADLFRTLHERIDAVYIAPVESFGDPSATGVIYQLVNTTQHLADGGRGYGHYNAVFRQVDGEWFCEIETPKPGWIGGGEPTA